MNENLLPLDPFEDVIADVKSGVPVVLVDDRDRENEGDLMVAAELVTTESVNFMIREGKGLICASLTQERLEALAFPPQVTENTAPLGTNFLVSVDHRSVATAGITAASRAATIRALVDEHAKPRDFHLPGWVFPLGAVDGGVLKRQGQTEGSVDLARIAGLKPAAVICEIMDDDGSMLNGEGLLRYCREHKLKITSVEEIANYRLHHEMVLRKVAECCLSDLSGMGLEHLLQKDELDSAMSLRVIVFQDDASDREELALVKGDLRDDCLVRIHSECLTGDVFGSNRCDCGGQFCQALAAIMREESGVLVYLHQEGRGIGLGNKLKAYELQDNGLDTVDANLELGFAPDIRNYRAAAQILEALGLKSVRLMTNNPDKVSSVEEYGLRVSERISIVTDSAPDSERYMQAKRDRLGHCLPK